MGSIETGKLADFVVLDRDLFAIPIEQVSEARVLKTVVEGKVVFKAAAEHRPGIPCLTVSLALSATA